MFRQTGNSDAPASRSGELLTTGTGGGGGGDATAANQVLQITQETATATSVASIDAKTPALGQALAAASLPIVLTAAQLVTLTPPAAITGFLTEADFDTKTGSLTETAPATDTASSGLNGRLQRIAQRISSLITALGSPFQAGGSIGNTSFAATQATASSLNAQVVGSIAHDTADSGNPVKVGAKAIAYGANPTDVASGDRTDLYANVAGIQFVIAGHPNALTILANYTSAQTNTAIVTVAGGTKIVALSCTIAADHANTVDVGARCGFATATTPTTTSVYISHPGIAPGSGIREAGAVAGADGEDFRITSEVPTGGSIDVVFKYFTVAA